jgi:hypothetical protein
VRGDFLLIKERASQAWPTLNLRKSNAMIECPGWPIVLEHFQRDLPHAPLPSLFFDGCQQFSTNSLASV